MSQDIVPQVFDNEQFGKLRVVKSEDGGPLFAASDVAKALGYRDAEKLTRRLDDDERYTLSRGILDPHHPMIGITESGLYSAVLGSRMPQAKAFKRWVTHEVLPAIRRDGGYIASKPDEDPESIMARALVIAQQTIERNAAKIKELQAVNDELKPKALFADAVGASDGTCLVGELAKMLKQNGFEIGQNRLFKLLRTDGYLGKSGQNYNVPTQRAMELGLFRIKETTIVHSDGHTTIQRTPKVTGKGQVYFVNRYCGAK